MRKTLLEVYKSLRKNGLEKIPMYETDKDNMGDCCSLALFYEEKIEIIVKGKIKELVPKGEEEIIYLTQNNEKIIVKCPEEAREIFGTDEYLNYLSKKGRAKIINAKYWTCEGIQLGEHILQAAAFLLEKEVPKLSEIKELSGIRIPKEEK